MDLNKIIQSDTKQCNKSIECFELMYIEFY